MNLVFVILACVVISALAFYAGSLLFKLHQQQRQKELRLNSRITNITQSINTIALAMEQQQCNVSEGCIRLFHLLEGLPMVNKPDYSAKFPGVYALYEEVKSFATHQSRTELSAKDRTEQDNQREEKEAQLESAILKDVAKLKSFTVSQIKVN